MLEVDDAALNAGPPGRLPRLETSRSGLVYLFGSSRLAKARREPLLFIRFKDSRMVPTDVALQEQQSTSSRERVVNDFSIQVATVNGSGSQTANLVLLRSILLMGVPVSRKNMFPSNIAGLPTWYTIRASKRGYIARKKEVDFLVAMNAETAKEDVLTLEPGAA